MTIKMTKLSRRPNGDWFARKGIPSDARESYKLAFGKSQEERFRRSSAMPAARAKIEFSDWLAEIEERIDRLRSSGEAAPQSLTQRQAHALIGRWYDWFTAAKGDEGLAVEAVDDIYERYRAVIESGIRSFDPVLDENEDYQERTPVHAVHVRAFVTAFSEIDPFLVAEGVSLTENARCALVDTLESDFVAALGLLRRRAEGDYSPDEHLKTFPKDEAISRLQNQRGLSGMTIWHAFEGWVKERKPAAATVNRWRGVFQNLSTFHEGGDVALFTEDHAVAWKNSLATEGRGTRTINEVWLTSAPTVFEWVKAQKKIKVNPFEGVKVAGSKQPVKTREPEFNDEEIGKLLKASLVPVSPRIGAKLKATYRWVPWLCAYTGARSGEMTQLRKEDFTRHKGGFWVINISPEAGNVKGNSYREVPVHEHLIAQGLLDFVFNSAEGPLFHDGTKSKVIDPLKPPRSAHAVVRNKLGEWVRKQGVDDKRIRPNHAWRHTFKRHAARAGIEQRLRDAICGHSDGRVGAIYETPTVEDLAKAIAQFPRYELG